jgi:hypothetical protein
MEKPVLRQLEDQLVEIFGRHPKRIHQGGLDGAGHLGDPGLIIAPLDDVDFGERHCLAPLPSVSMQNFDGQRDALTAANTKRDEAA